MTVGRTALCFVYACIAVLALIGTWGHNLDYSALGFAGTFEAFSRDSMANPASRSITIDLFFLLLAVAILMVLEARRLKMRGVWLYLIIGAFVAISVTVPLFLIHRERALALQGDRHSAGTLAKRDIAGLALVALITIVCMVVSFSF